MVEPLYLCTRISFVGKKKSDSVNNNDVDA
jgi:hypothetical protein